MRALRFFAMLKAARKLDAIEKLQQLNIAAVAVCDAEYFAKEKQRYVAILESDPDDEEEAISSDSDRGGSKRPNVFEAGSKEANAALMSLFASVH